MNFLGGLKNKITNIYKGQDSNPTLNPSSANNIAEPQDEMQPNNFYFHFLNIYQLSLTIKYKSYLIY